MFSKIYRKILWGFNIKITLNIKKNFVIIKKMGKEVLG